MKKKVFLIIAAFALVTVMNACKSTRPVCPAYSSADVEQVDPNS